ncbi:DUF3558 domain-containing protein [Nocardia sp. NPDC004068]|uniref:DUF3558 domain-containing protein n=1 Tax=Nocardia sp. NPDC004068 TaxID=3364303 RepID=UPI0036C0A6B9
MKLSGYGPSLALVFVAFTATACSTSPSDGSHETGSPSQQTAAPASFTSPYPTLTAPSLQPPTQPDKYVTAQRPRVVFDPCTWIPDAAVSQSGYDPNSRARKGDQVAEQTFFICNFNSKARFLSVISGNVTWEEDLQKNGAWSEPITINGRQAMWVRDPKLPIACDIHLRTKAGFVDVGVTLTLSGRGEGLNPCDGLLETATAIEPSIGKDN